jgi:hypothetical protein
LSEFLKLLVFEVRKKVSLVEVAALILVDEEELFQSRIQVSADIGFNAFHPEVSLTAPPGFADVGTRHKHVSII